MSGEIYFNRTKLYLAPVLSKLKVNIANVEAYGIYDVIYEHINGDFVKDYHLFVLSDPYRDTKAFDKYLKQIRKHKNYVDDYMFDLSKSNKHMVILRIPENYDKAYDAFVIGSFSKMYTMEELDDLGIKKLSPAGKLNAPWHILTKDEVYRKIFIEKINKLYNTDLLDEDHDPNEYDVFHISPKQEGFNDEVKAE